MTARPGDTIRVDLPGQAGSGYAWSATLDGAALVPGRTETGVAARPGGPAREILTYRATAPGSAQIVLVYQRPWETTKPPARQVVLSVEVTPPPEPLVPEQTP